MKFTHILQAIRANLRLGWDMEGNWAPPLVYLFVSLATPAASVLMLVFMYLVILGDSGDKLFLAFLMTGSAVFIFVRFILQGASWAVIEDREHYKILRYIYIAPVPFPAQIFGRVLSKLLVATVGATLTFFAAGIFLKVPFRPDGVQWFLIIEAMAGGILGLLALGWILASMMLLIDRMGWVWAEGVNGLLFLMSGAIIPLPVLPAPIAFIGKALPITYWAEIWRIAFFGEATALSLPGVGTTTLLGRLWLLSVFWLACAMIWHRFADRYARQTGMIEKETFY